MSMPRVLVALLISVPSPTFLGAQEAVPAEFEGLLEPGITTKPAETMLVVEAVGDPTTVGRSAFGLVFQTYFSLAETPKGPTLAPPRLRLPVLADAPRSEWVGFYALPVPETVTELPPQPEEGLRASLDTWEYGEVAEILHVGPYSEEEPTIRRLKDFVTESGYVIAGPHEEEYIRGPTMSGPGDPSAYLTIIRYQVRKADEE